MARKTNLNSEEVAKLLMVAPISVCEWVHQGMLHARISRGGEHHFDMEDVHQFARDHGILLGPEDQGRLRILVVDDDVRVARFLVDLFGTLSETVEAAAVHNAFQAGSRVHSFRPDVILLNLSLSSHDGFEVCRSIKSDPASRDVRIIAMSPEPSIEVKQRALMAGATACLAKPLNHHRLFEAIGLTMVQRNVMQPLQLEIC
jgi:CheY-like chemotaxis protein